MLKPTEEWCEYIRENIRYDPDTGYLWWIKPRHGRGIKRDLDRPLGGLSENGYLRVEVLSKRRKCHQIAWFLYYGQWPKEMLDHINGIKTDNRIENLREVTSQQNLRNRKSQRGSSSKYKGVAWHKRYKKWRSQITANYKRMCLGFYDHEEHAALIYDIAARKLHGDYARLNFPEEHEQGATHGPDV